MFRNAVSKCTWFISNKGIQNISLLSLGRTRPPVHAVRRVRRRAAGEDPVQQEGHRPRADERAPASSAGHF